MTDRMTWEQARTAFHGAQGGICAICGNDLALDVNLDHCHRTGFIRGVPCTGCNTRLGWYEANRRGIETYLARAAEYQAQPPRKRRSRIVRFDDELTVARCDLGALPKPANEAGL